MAKRVLVIDDDPGILDALQLALELKGYQVDSAVDPGALDTLLVQRPDLLLLDISLSGQDGRMICRSLKDRAATKTLPIILMTAGEGARKSALAACANAFLAKPFDTVKLLSLVRKQTQKGPGINVSQIPR